MPASRLHKPASTSTSTWRSSIESSAAGTHGPRSRYPRAPPSTDSLHGLPRLWRDGISYVGCCHAAPASNLRWRFRALPLSEHAVLASRG